MRLSATMRLPRLERKEAPYLEPSTVDLIAAELVQPYCLLIRLLGTAGLRFGEAAALRRRSVDLLGRRIIVSESLAEVGGHHVFGPTKSHAQRRVPITKSIGAALEQHLDGHVGKDPAALVFTSPEGAALRHSTFRMRHWLPALKRAGVPATGIHVLRHSAAAAMIRAGATPKAVQTILGHASAAFTLTVYGHIFDADLDEVADALERTANVSVTGWRRDADESAAVPHRVR
jgi:integrase